MNLKITHRIHYSVCQKTDGRIVTLCMYACMDQESYCPIKKKRALLIFDSYRAHISKDFEQELLRYDNIDIVPIPGGLTYLLQPLDVSVNKSFKIPSQEMLE